MDQKSSHGHGDNNGNQINFYLAIPGLFYESIISYPEYKHKPKRKKI